MKLSDAVRVARSVKGVRVEHARKFATHVVPEVVRPARIIWNQALGAIFMLLAVVFISYPLMHRENHLGIVGGVFLGAMMTFFGVGSFLRARRIGRPTR